MELTDLETSYIGACDQDLHGQTNLRRIAKSSTQFFDCNDYTFKVSRGYKRYVPLSLQIGGDPHNPPSLLSSLLQKGGYGGLPNLIEFQFMPHNMGPKISIITRTQEV